MTDVRDPGDLPVQPHTAAQEFGAEVLAWREAAGMSQVAVGAGLYNQQYVSKIERGERMASERFAECCDHTFQTPGTFVRLRERCLRQTYRPHWFEAYVDLEARATEIRIYNVGLMNGLLQEESYAEALFRKANPTDDNDAIRGKAATRAERRLMFDRRHPAQLLALIDESCLKRMVGSPAVMAAQMAHLLREAQNERITLQVLPFRAGTPATARSFTLLNFDSEEDPDVMWVENPISGQLFDTSSVTRRGHMLYSRLQADALPQAASLSLIAQTMEEWTHDR